MKRSLLGVLSTLSGGVLSAALSLAPDPVMAQSTFQRLPSDGSTVGDLVRKLPRAGDAHARTKVIGLDSTDSAFVFAAAGSVQGAGGTYFRSDVTIINHRSSDQIIAIGWLAQGVDNSNEPVQLFTIPARTPVILADFVAQTLGKSGLGAVLVLGQTSSGAADSLAQLDGFSRIWTNQPGAQGTVSQGFPSVSIIDSVGSGTAYALGNRHDASYRTNVGIVNLDSVSHTWTVGINGLHGSGSFAVTVPPVSMKQAGLPTGSYGDLALSFDTTGSSFNWSAYGASVDNVSGDSWSSHASQP
jgi:hypothetical protein